VCRVRVALCCADVVQEAGQEPGFGAGAEVWEVLGYDRLA